jgi:hypothetical protein
LKSTTVHAHQPILDPVDSLCHPFSALCINGIIRSINGIDRADEVYLPDRWKRPGVGKEKRAKAKDYAAMYDSFVPKPNWTIADQ